jgi:hypothetical protein
VGIRFDTTDTTPSAPASIARAAVGSSPLSTAKLSPRSGSNACMRSGSLRASLIATMPAWAASSATVSGSRSQPVRLGTL